MAQVGDGRGRPAATWLDTALLALVALAVAAPGLGAPDVLVFDEVYYVSDAVAMLDLGTARGFTAHPPLGTALVAAGMAALGTTPVGWRLAPLLAGVLSVVLLHRLSLRLFGQDRAGRLLAAAAAVLLVTEGTWLVLARTAMLDGLLVTFVLAAAAAATAATATDGRRRTLWLLAAGAAVGGALAVKWSGAVAGLLVLLLVATRDPDDLRGGVRRSARAAVPVLAAAAVVYALAWVPYATARGDVELTSCPEEAAPCNDRGGVGGVLAQHASLLRYHLSLDVEDAPGATPPSGWPLMQRPLYLFHPDCHTRSTPVESPIGLEPEPGCDGALSPTSDTVTLLGNPVVWFGFLTLLPAMAAVASRDRAVAAAVVGWTASWAPWLLVSRTAYLWYMAPAIPFAALGLVAAARWVPRTNLARTYAGATLGLLVGGGLGLLAALPEAGAVLGWGAGGAVGTAHRGDAVADGRQAWLLVGLVVAAAVVAGVVLRPQWVAVG